MAISTIPSAAIATDTIVATDIADDAIGTAELANDVVISTSGNITTTGKLSTPSMVQTDAQNLSGTYSTHEIIMGKTFTATGDLTVNTNLVLVNMSGTGDDVTIQDDGTATTITGTGTLEGGELLGKERSDLTRMTGELGSTITGSPNLNLTTGTLGRGVAQPIVRFVQRRLDAANVTFSANAKFNLHISDVADVSIVTHSAGTYTIQEAGTYETILNTATQTPNSQWLSLWQNDVWMNPKVLSCFAVVGLKWASLI